jgi:hypothetical protein
VTALQTIWWSFSRRSLLGSDSVILLAMVVHLYEGVLFIIDHDSFGAIGMAALLRFFGDIPWMAATFIFIVVALAVIGQWVPHLSPHTRFLLLVPQLTLFFVTALSALSAVVHGSYADGVLRSSNFILSDQAYRIGMPFLYAVAIVARSRARIVEPTPLVQ